MHISLTPELENVVRNKVASGLYNNASEVVREALRFMDASEVLVDEMKLAFLRAKLQESERDFAAGRYTEMESSEIPSFLQSIRDRAFPDAGA